VDGDYELELRVDDGDTVSDVDSVRITAQTGNVTPNAVAEAPETALPGTPIDLDGRASHDPDSGPDPLSFAWRFVAVPPGSALTDADLLNALQGQAGFQADVPGDYDVSLRVSDGLASDEALVRVRVATSVGPEADAGPDRVAILGSTVALDGSGSVDRDQAPGALSFRWRFVSLPLGSALEDVDLLDAEGPTPQFTPDVAGHYVIELEVSDGAESSFDSVMVVALLESEIVIDIHPGSTVNPVNPNLKGVLPVAILGSALLDVTQIDARSLRFGTGMTPETHGKGHLEDVNDDGLLDLLGHYAVLSSGIRVGDKQACLTATLGGTVFGGCDRIRTVPRRGCGVGWELLLLLLPVLWSQRRRRQSR
jgi:hypothetical protein